MSGARFEISACGDDALRILCGGGDIRHVLARQLAASAAWIDVVPGKENVTVSFDPHAERMADAQARLKTNIDFLSKGTMRGGARHTLPAEFGGQTGPDLTALATRLGRTEADIVEEVARATLTVDMLGFTPGFAYLTGLDPSLASERLAHPRSQVPAGSIGLITGQIGLYALDGPGGWPIIGRVVSPLFDRTRSDPFVLRPGDSVELVQAKPA